MKNRNLIIMYAIAFLQGMVFYGPIATLYRQMVGVTVFQITLIESVSLMLTVALELPWGIVADKIGYRRTMIFCCGLYFLSKIVFWRAEGFGGFLIERVMLSIVFAGLSGVDTSVLYLSCAPGQSQKAFGIYDNLGTAGLMIAAGVYSAFIGENYRLAGFLTVISYGLAALLALGIKEVRDTREKPGIGFGEFTRLIKRILCNRRLMLLVISIALLNETHQTITVFLNQLQYVKSGMTESDIAIVYIAGTVLGLIGGFSAHITKRLGARQLGLALFAVCCGACLALAATRVAAISIAAIMLLRISFSVFQPLQNELRNREVISENRATELSMNAIIMDGVAISTNLAFGSIADVSLSGSMLFGAAICAVAFVFFAIYSKHM